MSSYQILEHTQKHLVCFTTEPKFLGKVALRFLQIYNVKQYLLTFQVFSYIEIVKSLGFMNLNSISKILLHRCELLLHLHPITRRYHQSRFFQPHCCLYQVTKTDSNRPSISLLHLYSVKCTSYHKYWTSIIPNTPNLDFLLTSS